MILGWAILDETVSAGTIAGAALVVASVAAIVSRESPRRKPQALHDATHIDRLSFVTQPGARRPR